MGGHSAKEVLSHRHGDNKCTRKLQKLCAMVLHVGETRRRFVLARLRTVGLLIGPLQRFLLMAP